MTTDEMAELFEKHNDESLKFERVEHPMSLRPDLCAFLLLEVLVPGTNDILGSASHDEVFLDVDVEKLAAAATEDDVVTLSRCGVRYDSGTDSLAMFV